MRHLNLQTTILNRIQENSCYSIDIIIKEIIELLLQKNTEIMIYKYMLKYKGEMYRDVLIYKQYSAIMNSSEKSGKIEEVYEKLMVIDEKVR